MTNITAAQIRLAITAVAAGIGAMALGFAIVVVIALGFNGWPI